MVKFGLLLALGFALCACSGAGGSGSSSDIEHFQPNTAHPVYTPGTPMLQ